jgi:hypothetical protein
MIKNLGILIIVLFLGCTRYFYAETKKELQDGMDVIQNRMHYKIIRVDTLEDASFVVTYKRF